MPAASKQAKSKSTKSSTKPKATPKKKSPTTTVVAEKVSTPTPKLSKPINSKYLTVALVVTGVALLTYKFGPWLVPAIVDNRPVTRFELWSRMEKSYGTQTLDDVISEYTLESAINKAGVKVDEAKVAEQMTSLEAQFESVGGLDEALTQRGLTRAELEKQVSTQLAVEEILKDKVQPTEEEVQAYFDQNKDTIYLDQDFNTVKDQVTNTVSETKLRDAFLEWFAGVKEASNLKNFGL